MALRAKWQFIDRSVTHKIVYGPQFRLGPYYMLRVTSQLINCHMALSAMNYLINIILYVFIFSICLCQHSRSIFQYIDRVQSIYCFLPDFVRIRFPSQINNTKNMSSDRLACLEYNITNSSWHFGPNASLWTYLSPTKQYMDLSSASLRSI